MCEHKELIHVEVLWDYDWILYRKCKDCDYKVNDKTWVEFDTIKQIDEYSPCYQFKDWELVWFSIYKAKWLNIKDDLTITENKLWWTYWINWDEELSFITVKDITIPHIKNILNWQHNLNRELLLYFLNKLEWIIDYQSATKNELQG